MKKWFKSDEQKLQVKIGFCVKLPLNTQLPQQQWLKLTWWDSNGAQIYPDKLEVKTKKWINFKTYLQFTKRLTLISLFPSSSVQKVIFIVLPYPLSNYY